MNGSSLKKSYLLAFEEVYSSQAKTQWLGTGIERDANRLAETPSEVLIQPDDQQHSLGENKKHKA